LLVFSQRKSKLLECPELHPTVSKFFIINNTMKIYVWATILLSIPPNTIIVSLVLLEIFDGWKAFEVITERDNPTGSWELLDDFDGAGAWMVDSKKLRILFNHENEDATISDVNVHLGNLKKAITNTIDSRHPNVNFVLDARQAYNRWSPDLGATVRNTNGPSDTIFILLCFGQRHSPNASDGAAVYEAKDAVLERCDILKVMGGYSADGYADFLGYKASVEWTIQVPTSGGFDVPFRYAAANSRPAGFLVDSHPPLARWDGWMVQLEYRGTSYLSVRRNPYLRG
jgi:hypothetical protein